MRLLLCVRTWSIFYGLFLVLRRARPIWKQRNDRSLSVAWNQMEYIVVIGDKVCGVNEL